MPDIEPKNTFKELLEFFKKERPSQVRALPAWPPYDILIESCRAAQDDYSAFVGSLGSADFPGIARNAMFVMTDMMAVLITMGIDAEPIWQAMLDKKFVISSDEILHIIAAQTDRLDG